MNKIDISNIGLASSRALILFDAAARTGSFSKAAELANVGQPAVSHSVRQLESTLGVKLFRRLHRGVELTVHGQQLAKRVGAGLQEIRAGLDEVRVRPDQPERLTLLVSTSLASYWLMPRLARFKHAHPDVDLRCITQDTDRDIPQADFDLCIALGSGKWSGMQQWLFTDEELFPVCSPEYVKASGDIRLNQDLLNCELLHLEERYHSRFDWGKWFGHFGIEETPPKGWVSNDYSIVIQAALEGQGVAIGWRHIVQPLIDQGLLVQPIDDSIKTDKPFYILSPESRPLSKSGEALRDWLVSQMKMEKKSDT
ncbi:MAG: LysR substrate-binding domain-containing protein [Pseudomonadota bacterium]